MPHGSSHTDSSRAKCLIFHSLIALIRSGNNPNQKQEISSNTNNSISHNTRPKLEVFKHEHECEQSDGIANGIEDGILLVEDESFPLHHDEFEVEHVNEYEAGPYTEIVEHLNRLIAIEVPQDGKVQVRLIPHVRHAEIARVVAE